MSLSGIFSALSLKKGKSRRKKGQDTSSSGEEDASPGPAVSDRGSASKQAKGGRSIFGSSAKQESAGQSQGRVEVPPDRPEKSAWGKPAKQEAGVKKAAKKGPGYAGCVLLGPSSALQPCMGLRLVEWLFLCWRRERLPSVPRTATDVPCRYYESNGISIPSPQPSASSKRDDAKLDQMFDDLRGISQFHSGML